MAHFLEHLVFKGGEKYSTYRDVNETAERLGAQLNAYTSHDVVAFHITCRAESLMPAVDLLTDFVARARVDAEELDRERGVVIQEINRYNDQPSAVADMLLDRAAYGDHPLGRPVLGPAEHIASFTRDAILAFRERRWEPSRGGAFLAGDVSHADDDEARRAVRPLPRPRGSARAGPGARVRAARDGRAARHEPVAPPAALAAADRPDRPERTRGAVGLRHAARRLDGLAPVRRDPRAARPLLRDPLVRLGALRHGRARRLVGARLEQVRWRRTRGSARSSRTSPTDGPRDGEVERARAYAAGLDRAGARVDRRRGAPRGRPEGHVRRGHLPRRDDRGTRRGDRGRRAQDRGGDRRRRRWSHASGRTKRATSSSVRASRDWAACEPGQLAYGARAPRSSEFTDPAARSPSRPSPPGCACAGSSATRSSGGRGWSCSSHRATSTSQRDSRPSARRSARRRSSAATACRSTRAAAADDRHRARLLRRGRGPPARARRARPRCCARCASARCRASCSTRRP